MRILKADQLRGKRVIVLHSGAPKPNEGLTELELILQILRDNQIKPEVFFTYFPYGMQDKVFERGETNVAENLVEKLINYNKVFSNIGFSSMPILAEENGLKNIQLSIFQQFLF